VFEKAPPAHADRPIEYALDLTQPGTPMKWSHKPKPSAAAQSVSCCDVVNRGAAYAKGKIVYSTLDNHTVAKDGGGHLAARGLEDLGWHCLGLDLLRSGAQRLPLCTGPHHGRTVIVDAICARDDVKGR
jgi:hypothetical protein